MNEHEAIGNRIKQKRIELNLTQDTLANLCRVEKDLIILWEKGLNLPEGEQLFKLKKALNTSIDYIKYGDEDGPISSKIMGSNFVTWLIFLAVISCIGIIITGFSILGTNAPKSIGFSIIIKGVFAFSFIYWLAAILNSIIATRKTNEKILEEMIKLNKLNKRD